MGAAYAVCGTGERGHYILTCVVGVSLRFAYRTIFFLIKGGNIGFEIAKTLA